HTRSTRDWSSDVCSSDLLHRRRAAGGRPHGADPARVTPARRLGQHFLTDANILRKIVDALDPTPADVVLEIGPGKGSLTEQLLRSEERRVGEEWRDRWGP